MKNPKVKKGQILQKSGDLNTKVYLVESGLLRSYSIDNKGKEHIYTFAPENWLITDSCEPNMPCQLFIDVLEDAVVQIIDKEEAMKTPNIHALVRRLNTLQQRIIMLMSATAVERYEHFIKTYPNIIQSFGVLKASRLQ